MRWRKQLTSGLLQWLGVFGGFICVVPGVLFDKFGSWVTGIYGLVLVNLGFIGMMVLMQMGGSPPRGLLATFYFLEEQGAAASLYMVAVCILVHSFPSRYVGIITGVVAVAFGLSGLMWQQVAFRFFGFDDPDNYDHTNLLGLFICMLITIDICGVAVLLLAPHVPKTAEPCEAEAEDCPPTSLKAEDTTIMQTLASIEFAFLIGLFSVVSSQIISMSGYLSSIQSGFSSMDEKVFEKLPFIANVMGRMVYAAIVSVLVRRSGAAGIVMGSIWIHACYIVCFVVLTGSAFAGSGNAYVLYMIFSLGYSAYGGSVCFASSYTKVSFKESYIGIVVGLLTIAAVAVSLYSKFFPVGNSLGSEDEDRTASDFVRPWTAGLVTALLCVPLTFAATTKVMCQTCMRAESGSDTEASSDSDALLGE